MTKHRVWVESGAIVSKNSPKPLAISKVISIYVKEYDSKSKVKRAALIAVVFSFVVALLHPILWVVVFTIVFGSSYVLTKKYELRVSVYNNEEIGVVESGLCLSNDRAEFDEVVTQVSELKAVQQGA
ncbi:hypothetical protein L3V31_17290 [Vibrio sp. J1-1]|uniref:hypothetical protein n=1 Tax=Vibrio sp. J1-1 TaxID=2912251 RepID=UPI001F292284|nr:hypothetical protein [Vibrio sp. J1-1]MBR9873198.1 hypothetical protein [Vibrionaceae bacterium]MCF7483459.1 hypothetical protein [Vibrio sp. J1-1]